MIRYAAAYAYSYTLGLCVIAYILLGVPVGGPRLKPGTMNTLAANARHHADILTRKDHP